MAAVEAEITPIPESTQLQRRKSLRFEKLALGKFETSPTHDAEIWVSVTVIEVDTMSNQFKCDLEVEMTYEDPEIMKYEDEIGYDEAISLTVAQQEKYGIEQTKPRLMLENCIDPKLTYENLEANFSTGVIFIQFNWVAIYREVLELWRFPFDRQLLRIYIEVADVNVVPPGEWTIVRDEKPFDISTSLTAFSLAGYKAEWRESTDPAYEAQCHIAVEVQRKPLFYVFNFVLITFLVVSLNSAVISLGIDSEERLGYSANLVLTLVAFKFVIMQSVPIVNYLTLLDKYNLFAFVVLIIGTFFHAVVSPRAQNLFQLTSTDADNIDIILQLTLFGGWIGVHVLIFLAYLTGVLYQQWPKVYEINYRDDSTNIFAMKKRRNRKSTRKQFWEDSMRL